MRRVAEACAAALLAIALIPPLAHSLPPRFDVLQPVVGQPSQTRIREGETLLDIAFSFGVGFEQVARVNPQIDVWIPEPGAIVELPTRMVLPAVPHEDLVINVPEMRLFDFRPGDGPRVYSVAVGDPTDPTPTGEYRIGNKRVDPAWNVPESIRLERPELPSVVPPGPENPLGDRWMTLSQTSYGIHGTNNRWSIGHESTHGCVRMYNRDIHALYDGTPSGTRVRIVYQTVKLGRLGDGIYLEAHPDLYEVDPRGEPAVLVQLLVLGLDAYVDRDRVIAALREARGTPVRIGTLPEATSEPSS